MSSDPPYLSYRRTVVQQHYRRLDTVVREQETEVHRQAEIDHHMIEERYEKMSSEPRQLGYRRTVVQQQYRRGFAILFVVVHFVLRAKIEGCSVLRACLAVHL